MHGTVSWRCGNLNSWIGLLFCVVSALTFLNTRIIGKRPDSGPLVCPIALKPRVLVAPVSRGMGVVDIVIHRPLRVSAHL